MEPIKLNYRIADAPRQWHRALLKFLLLGPFTGGAVGLVHSLAVILIWMLYGKPDHFHGWNGLEFLSVVTIIAGTIVGLPYGLALVVFEKFTDRRIRSLYIIPLVVIVSFAISVVGACIEFRWGEPFNFLLSPVIAVVFGLLISVATSRKPQEVGVELIEEI
ncbi:MAG: hypothetical protein M3O30_16985 [Planctomycetota bacterium]|nr:hypothetical protein [Planctomycetota bacterium]